MQTSLYVAVSSQIALERRLNTLADNVANANTVGFRSTEVKFNTVLGDTKPTKVAFVDEGKEFINTQSGGLKQTGNSLDFAIKGDAWFAIDTPAGQVLTRDGRFTLTETGDLVTLKAIRCSMPAARRSRSMPMQARSRSGADGIIHQNGNQVASLGLYEADFSNGFSRFEKLAASFAEPGNPVVDGWMSA